MASTFHNPRNPICAFWASAAEQHLRETHPDLSIGDIRKLPFMQGVYQHLRDLSKGKRQASSAEAQKTGSQVDQYAALSQEFLDLGVTTMLFTTAGESVYNNFIAILDAFNNNPIHGIADFSTDDIGGFGLCLIIWLGMVGMSNLSTIEQELIDAIVAKLPLTQDQRDRIQQVWHVMEETEYSSRYRDASDYPGYQAIPFTLPANSQIIMLGDWGTALDDAHELLYAIWKKAFQANKDSQIVFIHLGDIYYCGLPYECEQYFADVFNSVGDRIASEVHDNRFVSRPPIFTLPGNHEYYSLGYGYFQLLDTLNRHTPAVAPGLIEQTCSFFCLRTTDSHWQFLGMDTGQADGNALKSALQAFQPYAIDILNGLVPMSFFFDKYVNELYQDLAGPFAPQLQSSEVSWLKDKLDHFRGKTIMCSHHQLFSREAEIDHSDPQYINDGLRKTFSDYFKDNSNYGSSSTKSAIAAWYWGHEHTYAIYQDGIFGLNKGRLLGSSSYEDTLDNDNPYQNKYPMVPFDKAHMDPIPIRDTNGLYYHSCAIFIPNGDQMGVTYYQFPSWNNLVAAPDNPHIVDPPIFSEVIKSPFKSLKPSWIGNQQIKSDSVVTDKSPAVTVWDNIVYLVYANDDNQITYATTDASSFQPTRISDAPTWTTYGALKQNGNPFVTTNSPATVAVNGKVYVFYVDGNSNIQALYYNVAKAGWHIIGAVPSGSHSGGDLEVGNRGLAVCYYKDLIYVVFAQSGSNNVNYICAVTYDPEQGTWTTIGRMKDAGDNDMKSGLTPALAASYDRMIITFQKGGSGSDAAKIQWAYMDDPTLGKWHLQGGISSTTEDGGSAVPSTTIGLTLTYTNNVWYLIYPDSGGLMRLCAMDDANNSWFGNSPVTVNRDNNHTTKPQTSQAPCLAISSGGGFLLYRGEDHNEIYWAYF